MDVPYTAQTAYSTLHLCIQPKISKTNLDSSTVHRTVRLFSAEQHHSNLYNEVAEDAFGLMKQSALLSGWFSGLVRAAVAGLVMAVIWYGAELVIRGELSIGEFSLLPSRLGSFSCQIFSRLFLGYV